MQVWTCAQLVKVPSAGYIRGYTERRSGPALSVAPLPGGAHTECNRRVFEFLRIRTAHQTKFAKKQNVTHTQSFHMCIPHADDTHGVLSCNVHRARPLCACATEPLHAWCLCTPTVRLCDLCGCTHATNTAGCTAMSYIVLPLWCVVNRVGSPRVIRCCTYGVRV